ncbi:MAG: FecR domain-containing protein [Cyclobacteriaceae bacterium]
MYDRYTVTDFILDKDFQQWVRSPTQNGNAYWQKVRLMYPQQEENIETAQKMLRSMKFREIPEAAIHSEAMLANILGNIEADEKPTQFIVRPIRQLMAQPWFKAAASLLLMLGLVASYYIWQHQQGVQIATAYGETREVLLPDGSQVVLNGNSAIRYANEWSEESGREVWLEGEAYFKVVKLASDRRDGEAGLRKFRVHTRELDIEVLGTEFNVHQRQEKSQVVLTEGKVKVNIKNMGNTEEVYLQPGELLEYSSEASGIMHKVVNPEDYLHWQDRQLVFDGESLREVAIKLQETFGYKVVFEDAAMAKYQFRGTVPFDDPDVLIVTLKQAYSIAIEKHNDTLIFKKEQAQ